jgi:two-component system, OmpR family, response regulator
MRCLVLVIEDEADTARYICNGLNEAGHTPILIRDGARGLQFATNERWDIIILDRMLPGWRRWVINHREHPRPW